MPSNTIMYSSDVTRRLTKGYGSTTQPIYVKSDGTIDTITATNLASFVDGAHKFVRLNGDTMTGSLVVGRNGESAVIVRDGVNYTDSTFRLVFTLNGSTGAQGIWSSGYSDGTTFTSDGKYLLYRDTSGNVKLYGNADTATKWVTARTLTIGSTGKSVDGSGNVSWSLAEIGAAASSHSHSYLPLSGGTLTGQLYINYTQDVGLNQSGSLVIGPKTGENIGIDNNEIMARNNSAASTLYINSEGGNVYIGSGGITSVGTITSSAGYLKSTLNGNTVQIGSQNTSFCHISNSAAIPFWFNQDITIAQGKHIGQAGSQYRPFQIYIGRYTTADSKALNSNNPLIEFANSDRSQYAQIVYTDFNNQGGSDSITFVSNQSDLRVYAPKVHNAVWNDYAETRATNITEPGRVVVETITGIMVQANDRLMAGCKIISDTYGTCMGREEDTPIAVSGRVLVYPYQPKEKYELGAAVCSAPGGTVDIMTREEIMKYPERIIGTVSEIPDYDIWYAGQRDDTSGGGAIPITVNGRIWIYVR